MRRMSFRLIFAVLLLLPLCCALAPGTARAVPTTPHEATWFVNLNRFAESAHHTLSCEDCHGDMQGDGKKHPDIADDTFLKGEATRLYDYSRCGACHRNSYERYLKGAHAKALEEEMKGDPDKPKAPVCGDCHSAHYDRSHLSRVELGRKMTGVCGACHPAQKSTYLMDYHGKAAVNLGHEPAAFCTDCHGAHNCLSLKNGEAALRQCRRCHPGAGPGFAEYVVHPTTADIREGDSEKSTRVAVIKVVTTLMSILVLLVVAFFYGHSLIWLLRELHEKLRKH